jgi:hypothetical protein
VVLGYPGMWLKDPATGVDWVHAVHGEQGLRLHRPVPPEGEVIGRTRVSQIIDKGPVRTVHELPTRAADHCVDFATQSRCNHSACVFHHRFTPGRDHPHRALGRRQGRFVPRPRRAALTDHCLFLSG